MDKAKTEATDNQKDTTKDVAKDAAKDVPKDAQKQKAIGAVLGDIEKQFGKGAIMRLGDGGEGAGAVA